MTRRPVPPRLRRQAILIAPLVVAVAAIGVAWPRLEASGDVCAMGYNAFRAHADLTAQSPPQSGDDFRQAETLMGKAVSRMLPDIDLDLIERDVAGVASADLEQLRTMQRQVNDDPTAVTFTTPQLAAAVRVLVAFQDQCG